MKYVYWIFLIIALSYNTYYSETFAFENNETWNYGYNSQYWIKPIQDIDFWWIKDVELISSTIYFKTDDLELNEYQKNLAVQNNWVKIPKKSQIIQKIFEIIWVKKINKLLDENIIQIYGSIQKCTNNSICTFENYQDLYTNTIHKKQYKIISQKDTTIKLKLYPISKKYYEYDSLDQIESRNIPKISFFDSSLEYYKISWTTEIKNNTIIHNKDFIKKYDSINLNRAVEFPNFETKKADVKNIQSKMIIPYYTGNIELKKWVNFVHIEYQTYSDLQDSGLYQINIK